MVKYERRRFVKISAAGAVGASVTSGARAAGSSQEGARKPMRLGLIVGVGNDPARAIAKVHELGVPTCQVGVESFGPEMVTGLRGALDRHGIEATSLVIGGPGPEEYDFYNGPMTIGFVPRQWRAKRIERAQQTSDFAQKRGIPPGPTHPGVLPQNPNDPGDKKTIEGSRGV